MITTLRRTCLAALASATLAASASARDVDSNDPAVLYGRGVHAYFQGRCAQAEKYLSQAMAIDPNDPRMFYFRALCRMRQGRTFEARDDMKIGAALEAEGGNRFAIGKALERVQGSDRLMLEMYRRKALVARVPHGVEVAPNRTWDESDVLYREVVIPLEEFGRAGNPRELSAAELAARAARAEARATAASAPPQPPAAVTADPDPFSDDAAATADPAAAEPPAAGAAEAAPPIEVEPPADVEEPSDTPPPADADGEDPFMDLQ